VRMRVCPLYGGCATELVCSTLFIIERSSSGAWIDFLQPPRVVSVYAAVEMPD